MRATYLRLNLIKNVASISGILGALVDMSATIMKQDKHNTRLDSARNISNECQTFMTRIHPNNYDMELNLDPHFVDQMTHHLAVYVQLVCGWYPNVVKNWLGLVLISAHVHHQQLRAVPAHESGWTNELDYWRNICIQISGLLKELEDYRTNSAVRVMLISSCTFLNKLHSKCRSTRLVYRTSWH